MSKRIDGNLAAFVREDLQREASQTVTKWRAQPWKSAQEPDRPLHVSEKPLRCVGRSFGEISCRFAKLFIGLGYEADAHD